MENILDLLKAIPWWGWILIFLAIVAIRDIFFNRKHTITQAMLNIGCIQAQECHTNKCPTGVATQNRWLQAGINVKNKTERVNYFFTNFRKELLEITHACGYEHLCQFRMQDGEINPGDRFIAKSLAHTFLHDKTVVPYTSFDSLVECANLGGAYRKGENRS